MNNQVGNCPKCGAPIYSPSMWMGITPPPPQYTCNCNPQYTTIGTGTTTREVMINSPSTVNEPIPLDPTKYSTVTSDIILNKIDELEKSIKKLEELINVLTSKMGS